MANSPTRIEFEDDEWTYPESDGFKHGQHGPKMYGSFGYVNWHLINSEEAAMFRRICEDRKQRNGNIRVQSLRIED
jgi:hypothetical protein